MKINKELFLAILLVASMVVGCFSGGGGGAGSGSAPANVPPVANAGTVQNVAVGTAVTLDGSASSDANNDPLSFSWTLTSVPASSTATLSGANSVAPTFTADMGGTYVASLMVSDGTVNSTSATVSINAAAGNVAPMANAGADQNAAVGALVTLDGSASSDANNDPLTYTWSLTSKPASSNAVLSSPTAVKPTFTADRAGTYVASLTVSDGTVNSARAPVSITAIPPSITLTPSAGPSLDPANPTFYLRSVTVAVTDGLGNPIPGVTVALTLLPVDYHKGQRDAACNAVSYGPFLDEDANANSLLDPGEDVDGPGGYTLGGTSATLGTPDGALWPPLSAAGFIPTSVTTAAVGVSGVGTASFDWVYLSDYADWITAKFQATASIQGGLYSGSATLPLLSLPSIPCTLPDSPFN